MSGTLHQWDYLFAIGLIFSALDAFMIGANDVANSFATSVSSKSLTLRQACLAAAVMEFLGAVLVGARVTSTIKDGIIPSEAFQGNAGVQLLGFTCAIVASASWLSLATRLSWPVSTTYSIVSAVIGVGIATAGWDAPKWGWNKGKGIAAIFSGLVIAPALAGGFGIVLFCFVKFAVLLRSNPTRWGLITAPLIFFLVGAVLTMAIIFKGSPSLGLKDLEPGPLAAAIVGTAAVVALLSILFWLPYVHAKVVKKDHTLRWYHFFLGPLLWKRPPPPDAGAISAVPDYRIRETNELDASGNPVVGSETDSEKVNEKSKDQEDSEPVPEPKVYPSALAEAVEKHPIEGAWAEPRNLGIVLRYRIFPWIKTVLTHGTSVDIHALQAAKQDATTAKHIADVHSRARQFPNDTEHLYSFMQVFTACVASFAHGANDVSNAIGPFSVIYHTWKTGETADKTPVPVWALAFGGAMLVLGLALYGYNIMRILGNRITLHSPSRGFSMELAASITVILASQFGIPVSTTMCITGATIGVALCNGDIWATNWRAIGWIYVGWIATVPIVATLSGCLMGILLNAPHF
ncbi:sodium:inorganic phosphate symporter [Coprinopsis cinerea okayama7|uniref:Phosphate transporter n=1 Tax=Coprinopsis cinerea (strain Okayama-7 / 130 / ATCC MYA-4618 / FGSC 9003) TaxID=240176 RepID=A8P317_COPC7|nr:sodium:inorganic phosphate symporter [Coprinopsis cinerea okayama7\|eukprot:XP_001838448.1 sodium:inorganic phosphate symporter [Coprinopsis cinerea okayama7\